MRQLLGMKGLIGKTFNVSFGCLEGLTFLNMKFATDMLTWLNRMNNVDSDVFAYNVSSGWSDDDMRPVDFGEEEQEVSKEFYIWLSNNATKK